MSGIQYSDKYTSTDDKYEYRGVRIPSYMAKVTKILSEKEWLDLGVVQTSSLKWEHYANYPPDNVMLFRRLK